jgi:adenylylsulfate kinase-like enzyme
MIILLFGQPASGKTTLANEFTEAYHKARIDTDIWKDIYSSMTSMYKSFVLIDGDRWRDITQNKNYTKEGRIDNLKQAFNMALYLEKEGYTPVLSFVTPYEELRQYLRDNSIKLAEIYLTYSEDRGRNNYFASEFEKPLGEYLHLETSTLSISDCVTKISKYVAEKSTR